MELEVSFLVEMQPLSCRSGSGPALPSISGSSLSHSPCASDRCSVSFSQMAVNKKNTETKFPNKEVEKLCFCIGRLAKMLK